MAVIRALRPSQPITVRMLATALLVALALSTVLSTTATRAVGGSEFVRLTNVYRAGQGLAPVSLHAAVDAIAVERGNQMAARNDMYHDIDYIKDRLGQLGVCWSRVGEIIAYERGYPTHSYERTMQQWWNSSGHRAIIVGDFNAAGGSWSVGSSGATYSVMVFIKACGSSTVVGPAPIGRAVLGAGSHTGYQFDGKTVVGSKTASLARASGADVLERAKINGRTYLKIANGIWAGYWIPETWRSYLPGFFDRVSFDAKRLVIDAGTHVGFKYYSSGNRYARLQATLWRRSGANAVGWAIINGQPHYLVANGIWAGYWLPDKAGVWPAR
jgi:uncharacterized protein YkwD